MSAVPAPVPSEDPFEAEILRSYLVSTVREMVVTTTRTAFSTCFCHGEDFTCGLFDADGRMIAQDQGVGVHAGGLEAAVAAVRRHHPDPRPGDVVLHNDPYDGGTHQADVMVCRPVFVDGRLLGYAANRGHWSDVGGMAPGGWSGTAQDVVQEGLRLCAVTLYSGGVLNVDVQRMLLANVRMARQCWGDLQAQIASAIAAERRIAALVERVGFDGYARSIDAALLYARRRTLAALARVPDGVAHAEDFHEDDADGGGPYVIRLRLEKHADRIVADFTGTDPHAMAPINCTTAACRAAVIGPCIAVLDPEIPLNRGVTELFEVISETGTLVDPTYPAPCFGTTADPADRVMEIVLRALAQLAPDETPAGSYATGQNATGGGTTAEGDEFLWYSYQAGGVGARKGADGNSAEWHMMANSKNESMEAWEARYPVEHLSFSLVPDSGGAGRWRGGLGTERRWRVLSPTRLAAIADHHRTGSHGGAGGGVGRPNGFAVERDGERRTVQAWFDLASPSKFANLPLRAGDVFVTVQGGGGGYGPADERSPQALADDVRAGYVTEEAARRDYPGVLDDGGAT